MRSEEFDLWVADAKQARLIDVVRVVQHGLKRSGANSLAGPCPHCGGRDRLWVNFTKNRWSCRGCRPIGGSAIDFVQHFNGGDFIATCVTINGTPAPDGRAGGKVSEAELQKRRDRIEENRQRRERLEKKDAERRVMSARQIWLESGPLGGSPAEYLRRRGIDVGFADDQIRAHNGLSHPDGGVFPALVGRVSNADGEGTGVWRIFCKSDGSGKAPVSNPKLGIGIAAGGAVRIGGLWNHIAVAEGIETALAVRELVGGGLPCWAALSTSGMAGLVLPPDVERVDIYADGDTARPPAGSRATWLPSPGMTAAHQLADQLRGKSIEVKIVEPPAGNDWLQVLQATKKMETA